ncbi:hypothetical protein JZU48_04275 [bacterium]|nr:hypothetical protein [bacterium]
MTDDEFRMHLDRYGGDLERWPPAAARLGRRLLAQSPAAQALLDETALIERVLSESEPPPPLGLADRIFAAAFAEKDDTGADRTASPAPH